MKQLSFFLTLIFTMLLASACSSITTRYPLSGNPEPPDKKKFEGVWLVDEDEVVYIKFAANGIAQIAG